jgi:hypothetical protein
MEGKKQSDHCITGGIKKYSFSWLWTSVGSRRAALAPVIMGCHFSQDLCMMTQSIIQTGHGWATPFNFRRVQVAPVQMVALYGVGLWWQGQADRKDDIQQLVNPWYEPLQKKSEATN